MHSNPPDYRSDKFTRSNPWGLLIDSGLCSICCNNEQGKCTLNKKDGWTCIAFWDRSVDTRQGSNSAFLAEGDYDFPIMLGLFKEKFPEVVSRFKFELVLLS
jgi:hypothetical protein